MSSSESLLRTLAAVPPTSRVLDLGCRSGRHTEALVRLGFDVHACAPADADVQATREALRALIGDEANRRVTRARPEALGYPDAFFDWIVADGAFDADHAGPRPEPVEEARRVLRPGGWLWVAADARALGDAAASALTALFEAAGFALAERPFVEEQKGYPVVRAIYRRVDAGTIG